MTFEKGSLILVDYDVKVQGSNAIFETTSKDTAMDHSIYDPNTTYGPKPISIGVPNYPVLPGFSKELEKMSVGETNSIVVEPEDGWGQRDPKKIRTYPVRKLENEDEAYSIGDTATVDGKKGKILYIGSGRVKIDLNHELAGKTIIYDAKVTAHLETPNDVIDTILNARAGADAANFELTGTESLSVTLTSKVLQSNDLVTIKNRIARDAFTFVPDLDFVQFVEKHENHAKARRKANDAKSTAPSFDNNNDSSNNDSSNNDSSNNDSSNRTTQTPQTFD